MQAARLPLQCLFWRENLCHQRLETRIAAQRIEHRVDLDQGEFIIGMVAVITLEEIDRLVILTKRYVHKSKRVVPHITLSRYLLQLPQSLQCFVALSAFGVALRE